MPCGYTYTQFVESVQRQQHQYHTRHIGRRDDCRHSRQYNQSVAAVTLHKRCAQNPRPRQQTNRHRQQEDHPAHQRQINHQRDIRTHIYHIGYLLANHIVSQKVDRQRCKYEISEQHPRKESERNIKNNLSSCRQLPFGQCRPYKAPHLPQKLGNGQTKRRIK